MSTKEARKRKATLRLEESDEVLAKKLKEAQDRRGHVHLTSETSTSMSRTSTVPSTRATTPQASPMSTNDDNTIDDIEIIHPPPQNNNSDIEPPSDNNNNADQDDQRAASPEDPQNALGK